jgi:hypothetical protein
MVLVSLRVCRRVASALASILNQYMLLLLPPIFLPGLAVSCLSSLVLVETGWRYRDGLALETGWRLSTYYRQMLRNFHYTNAHVHQFTQCQLRSVNQAN